MQAIRNEAYLEVPCVCCDRIIGTVQKRVRRTLSFNSYLSYAVLFLGAFIKIAKSDYMLRHVCLSVRPHGTTRLPLEGFSWNLIFQHFSKICRENSSFIKIDTRITLTLHEHQYTFLIISLSFFLSMKNVSDKSCTENKTRFVLNNFFFKWCLYDTTWKNMVESDRPQITTWHIHIACWIPKVTNTLRIPKYTGKI